MHELRSNGILRQFRIAALLLVVSFLLAAAAVVVLAHATVTIDWKLTGIGIGFAALALLSGITRTFVATQTSCPLCLAPVLATRHCSKHPRARRFMGSHRLRIALAILFLNSFRCPYCNELTAMKVRKRHSARDSLGNR